MKPILYLVLIVVAASIARADANAVMSAAREFQARYDAAIPAEKKNDQRAIGRVLHWRLTELDAEIAIQDALRIQLASARNNKNEEMAAYCSAFTMRSLDMLEHMFGQCADSLKIAGIAAPDVVIQSRAAAVEAIKAFRKELEDLASPQKKKG